jgi:hypothetical protein
MPVAKGMAIVEYCGRRLSTRRAHVGAVLGAEIIWLCDRQAKSETEWAIDLRTAIDSQSGIYAKSRRTGAPI